MNRHRFRPHRSIFKLLLGTVLAVACFSNVNAARSHGSLPLHRVRDVPLAGGTSRFDYESMDVHRHLLFISHLGASMVTVFNTLQGRVVANIPHIAGVHGVLAVPALGKVFASATERNEIDVIDESSFKVVAHIPAGVYPDGIAYVLKHHEIVVSDEAGRTDTVIDTNTNRRLATIALGGEAGNTAYDAPSDRVFVAVQTLDELVAINPATNRIITRSKLPALCENDHGVLVDPVDHLAFITCDGNAKLLTLDLPTLKVTGVQTVGNTPDVLTYDSGLRRLYVASESGVVAAFAVSKAGVRKLGEGFVAEEAHSIAVDPDTHRVYIPLQNVAGQAELRILTPN